MANKVNAELKEILTINNPGENEENEIILSEPCDEIDCRTEAKLVRQIVSELKKKMRKDNLVYLTAPQIGYNSRIFCINFKDIEIKTFINPMCYNAKGLQMSRETCASLPGREYLMPRNNELTVIYQMPDGKPQTQKLMGLAAMLFQHCSNHLDGVCLCDIALELPKEFDSWNEDEQSSFVKEYLDSLDIREKEVQEEIDSNKELSDIQNASKFIASVQSGETKLYDESEDKPFVGESN